MHSTYQAIESERTQMRSWQSAEERSRRVVRDMQRITPWLSKRGLRRTCPHAAGTCPHLLCCRGTAKVQAAEAVM